MESTHQNDPQESTIQGLLALYLSSRDPMRASADPESGHIDEDSLSAFADGNLSERETIPVVSHLVDCSFCRHVTAELVRLDAAFAESGAVTTQPASKEPSKVSKVLAGILDRILGSGEASVFAHGEDQDEPEKEKEEDTEKPEV